jgi:diadenosine tetraphosphate (Ap4A) HIT family hydrolase
VPLLLPADADCYFCRILSGRTEQWAIVEQHPLTMTMLNGRQYEIGQCIVVSRRHAPTLLDLSVDEGAAVIAAAQRAARALVNAFDPDGILLYQNNGVGSGQEVPHFHLHVVPRRAQSDWGSGPPHLAKIEGRPVHLDHTADTPDKRHTADLVRNHLR